MLLYIHKYLNKRVENELKWVFVSKFISSTQKKIECHNLLKIKIISYISLKSLFLINLSNYK